MGVELTQRDVELGYHHIDTGRWIDQTYTVHTAEFTGADILQKLKQKIVELEYKFTERGKDLETTFTQLVQETSEKFDKAVIEYEIKVYDWFSLPWYKKIFTRKPTHPVYVKPSEKRVWRNKDILEKLQDIRLEIDSLDDDYGKYVVETKYDTPFEYDLVVKKEITDSIIEKVLKQIPRKTVD